MFPWPSIGELFFLTFLKKDESVRRNQHVSADQKL